MLRIIALAFFLLFLYSFQGTEMAVSTLFINKNIPVSAEEVEVEELEVAVEPEPEPCKGDK